MAAPFLTRGEAHDLIIERHHGGDDPAVCLLDLQQHWIGHRDHEPQASQQEHADAIAAFLHEYVDAQADQRTQDEWDSRGGENPPAPSDDNPTDLTAPEEA